MKSLSCVLAGAVIVSSLFLLRTVCQLGFTQLIKANQAITAPIDISPDHEQPGAVTFEHENANVDSGRFVLWQQGVEEFLSSPIIGIGKGNIYEYGNRMFENGVKFSKNYGELAPIQTDFHNGYLTILVCSGLVGFILFAIFGIRFFLSTTRHVLRDESLSESVFPCMYSFLCAYLFYAFIEVTLLYNLMFNILFFWLILGYTSCFLTKNMPDHPIERVTILGKSFRKTLF